MEEDPVPAPLSDREVLVRILNRLEQQQADIETIRWRTGCLYAWLVITVIFGVFAYMAK